MEAQGSTSSFSRCLVENVMLIQSQLEHGDPVRPDAGPWEACELVGDAEDLASLPHPPRHRRRPCRPHPPRRGAGVGRYARLF